MRRPRRCIAAQTAISNLCGRRLLCGRKPTAALAARQVALATVIIRSIARYALRASSTTSSDGSALPPLAQAKGHPHRKVRGGGFVGKSSTFILVHYLSVKEF